MSPPRDPYGWVHGWAWPLTARGNVPSLSALVLLRLAELADQEGLAQVHASTLAVLVGRDGSSVREALQPLASLRVIVLRVAHGMVVATLLAEAGRAEA